MRGKSFASTASTLPTGLSDHNAELSGDVVTMLFINYEWRRLISDALQSYADSLIRYLPDADIDDFRNKFQALLNDLYSAEIMDNSPVGMVAWFPALASKLPAKWLVCDGDSYLRDDYPDLFYILRDTFPFDATTFDVPNLTGQFLYGAGNDPQIGDTGGDEVHTLTLSEIPAHSHVQRVHNNQPGGGSIHLERVSKNSLAVVNAGTTTADAGGGDSHNNMPPYIRGYWCIKALP